LIIIIVITISAFMICTGRIGDLKEEAFTARFERRRKL